MNISSRIRTIGDFISDGEIIADVGADHGLLELYLLARHKDIFITAIENKSGPFAILDKNLRGFNNVRLSLSDGLDDIDPSTTTIVIAGMGGLNIKKILEKNQKKLNSVQKIILDAHRDIDVARKTVTNYGFKINKEIIVYEDEKFYVINEFLKDNKAIKYSNDEIEFGYKIYRDILWPKYRDHLIKRNEETLQKIENNSKNQNKILKLKKLNERLLSYGKD